MPTPHEQREMDQAERELLGRRARPGAQILDATGRLQRQPDVEPVERATPHAERSLARCLAWAIPLGLLAWVGIFAALWWLL